MLERRLNLRLLTFYGVGTILGAGIYVLIGEVAARAGPSAPLSFLVAAVLATVTGLSFAELSARHPSSAGEAVFVQEAFGIERLSTLVGLLIAFTGVVSAAAITVGFYGYVTVFLDVPKSPTVVVAVGALTALACWGIAESVTAAAAIALLEIGGLVLVVAVGLTGTGAHAGTSLSDITPPMDAGAWAGIGIGAFLAFYAYIGFEDMVNVAEEVIEPQRTMPRAILLAIGLSTALYLVVAVVAVLVLPIDQLAASKAPLADMYRQSTGSEPVLITAISMIAVINGALVQIIMGSRVLYGLAFRGWLPAVFASVNARTRTPVLATVAVGAIVASFAAALPLATLAQVTSLIILVVFALVNLALWRIKRDRPRVEGVFCIPRTVPMLGAVACLALIAVRLMSSG